MALRDERLAAIRKVIPEITPSAAVELQARGAMLVDIREESELAEGAPQGARHLPRGFLELRIEEVAASVEQRIVLICAAGSRSLLAADSLQQMGYRDVQSVSGGFRAWREAGLPIEQARGLKPSEMERYARHLLVPEIGFEGQRRLKSSSVLVVGAGGLGSPAAYYLAAAGVGVLGIVDDDRVERSNLQRQILHRDEDVGELKVESARRSLLALNPEIEVRAIPLRLTSSNLVEILARFEVIVDGSDNFATRYLLNDACVETGIPIVHGAIHRFDGQVSVFWPSAPGSGPCYRCLFPVPPPPELAPSCAEAGVLGVLPGVIGCLQAAEALKLLLKIGEPLTGKFLQYEALSGRFSSFAIDRNSNCRGCGAAQTGSRRQEIEDLGCARERR
jgi:molybdopterin/thiamine biosynthesis adenylyltransferase/rhodanese-related sulfurtransferase